MDQQVDGGDSHGLVGENLIQATARLIGGNGDAAAFIASDGGTAKRSCQRYAAAINPDLIFRSEPPQIKSQSTQRIARALLLKHDGER